MATNPMQRRSRNSFLLGMFVMLLIASLIIGLLVFLLIKEKKENKEQEKVETEVYILNQDVTSGQIITSNMLSTATVSMLTVPANAITDYETFMSYSLIEKNTGNIISYDKNGKQLYVTNSNGQNIKLESDGTNYYKVVNGQKQLVEFLDVPLVAKTNMKANTVVSLDNIAKSDEITSDDMRVQEYGMISLPVKLNVDDYIDVRLRMPSGLDYIVLSKKRVIDVNENTVWLIVTEDEINTMSAAIVEAYKMTGAELMVNLYVEPGLQQTATPTYVVSQEVYNLIQSNPNIVGTARNELTARYNADGLSNQRQNINNELKQYTEQALSNVEQAVKEEIESRKEQREKYLEGLTQITTVEE